TFRMCLNTYPSFNIPPGFYAMMERMDTQVQGQGRRRQGGLCHGRGSGAGAPAPAGPDDLSHPAGRGKTGHAVAPCTTTPAPRKEGGLMTDSKPTTRLQQLIHRTDRVLAVMHAPTAAHARLMELAGAEVAFVGTSGVVGTYTGLADVGVATMTECLTIAG